jgi:hypothetical protein
MAQVPQRTMGPGQDSRGTIGMPNSRIRQHDFTKITGIGARIDAKLKQAGILTFAQLGRTSVEKLAAVSGYSIEQIEQKDWTGQAKALAPAPAPTASSDEDLRPPDRHNFSVELQLDATSGAVLSSDIRHVRSGDRDSWRGWDGDRLVSFIEVRAGPETRPTTDTTAGEDLPGPVAGPEKDRVPREPSLVGFAQVRADRLLFPGSGPPIASLRLNRLEAYAISASTLDVEVYGQRPPFSKGRLLGRARTRLRREQAITLDVDLLDPASETPLKVFAVLTFLDGTDVDKPPVWVELDDAELTLQSRLSRHQT